MKVVTILGSPRIKGNSATIASHFNQTAAELGAQTKTFALNEMTFRGCQAWMACKEKVDRCVLKDDLEQVLDEIRDTDILVLATPVYFMDITSQLGFKPVALKSNGICLKNEIRKCHCL